MPQTVIRSARPEDAAPLAEILRWYVLHTAIIFDYEPSSAEAFRERMAEIQRRYPFLVAEEGGVPLGYAFAHPFVGRAAYDWSCELTVYLHPDARGRGLGRRLYAALEAALRAMGIRNLYACIGVPETDDEYLDHNSADFHARMGFREVGRFRRCGYKFGRWYHMVWMEKLIGGHETPAPPVRGYPSVREDAERSFPR